jgi:hypothetical protein
MPSEISDYIFIDDPANQSVCGIQCTNAKYYGIRYKYGTISVDEDVKHDKCQLNFDYKIIYKPACFDIIDLNADTDFKNFAGDVLCDILTNQEYKIGKHGDKS